MKQTKILRTLLALLVLGAIVTPIAVAGARGHRAPRQTATTKALKLLQGMKKEAAAIAGEIAGLRAKVGGLEAPKQPPPASPIGPAGGDLTGSYPNPRVRTGAIGSANVIDQTVTSADIAPSTIQTANIAGGSITSEDVADGSLGQNDLAPASIGAAQLLGVHFVKSGPNSVGDSAQGGNSAVCPPGERLLSGGATWGDANNKLFIVFSMPDKDNPNQWDVEGRNDSSGPENLFAYAVCLRSG